MVCFFSGTDTARNCLMVAPCHMFEVFQRMKQWILLTGAFGSINKCSRVLRLSAVLGHESSPRCFRGTESQRVASRY